MKSILRGLFLTLAAALSPAVSAYAQNSLSVQSKSGDPGLSGSVVRITAENTSAIGALEFLIVDDSDHLTPTSVRLGAGLKGTGYQIDSEIFSPDSVKVIIFSVTGDTLTAGERIVAEILYDVDSGAQTGEEIALTIGDIVVGNPDAVELDVDGENGVFTITQTPASVVSLDTPEIVFLNDDFTVEVEVDNGDLTTGRQIAGAAFTLIDQEETTRPVTANGDGDSFSDILDFVSVAATGRAEDAGFTAGAEETANGLVITLSHPDGDALPAGDGPVVAITFDAANPGTAHLAFDTVTLTDEDDLDMPPGQATGGDILITRDPQANDDTRDMDEDASLTIDILGNDRVLDGEEFTVALLAETTIGAVELDDDDAAHYTPPADFNGEDRFSYILTDGHGVSDTATVTIVIHPVNDAPEILTKDLPDAAEGIGYSALIKVEDVEGDPLTFALDEDAPDWLGIDQDGLLSGTPGFGDVGEDVAVTVSVSDGQDTTTAAFLIDVTPDADAPVFVSFPEAQEVTDQSAAIIWETNEPATASVIFESNEVEGKALIVLSSQAGKDTLEVADLSTDGRLELSDLTASTPYSAVVIVSDARSNKTTGDPVVFTTLDGPDTKAPVFTRLPVLSGRTDHSLTFTWQADEAAKGILTLISADGSPLSQAISDTTETFDLDGELTIDGLDPDTTYAGTLTLFDASGNTPGTPSATNNLAGVEGKTLPQPDDDSPIITEGPLAIGITDTKASIRYATNEPATTIVQFGTSTTLGSEIADKNNFTADHEVQLSGLTPARTYYFRIGGADRTANQMAFTAIDSFRTEAAPDTLGPVFTGGPSVITVSDVSAVIRWTTDEPASFAVKTVVAGRIDTLRINKGDFESNRTITVAGLTPGGDYRFVVVTRDKSGNRSAERSGDFTTEAEADTIPPRLVGSVSVTDKNTDRFTVEWVTDEASDSRGAVGDSHTGNVVVADDAPTIQGLTTRHAITFRNLTSNTLYFFQVLSFDANGNDFVSKLDSVRTLPVADTTPPIIRSISAIAGRTDANIEWKTTEAANSRVLFSADSAAVAVGNASIADVVSDPGFDFDHSVTLTGLKSATTYWYRVQSADRSGNRSALTPAKANDFSTQATADVTSPEISSISATPGLSTATIFWLTDERSNSTVSFDSLSASSLRPLQAAVSNPDLVNVHEITLTNLLPGKTYRYRVRSEDAAANASTAPGAGSVANTFTTEAVRDTLPPALLERPDEKYLSNTTVIISWITDELSDDRVFFKPTSATLFEEKIGSTTPRTVHRVTLDNLIAGTTYDFVISSRDAAGNELRFPNTAIVFKVGPLFKITGILVGSDTQFTTNPNPDTRAPVILSGPVVLGQDATSVTLQWVTDEVSTSIVNYGTGGTLSQRAENGALVTTHTATLTGLVPSGAYTYTVGSTDPANNGPSTSAQAVVQTAAQPDVMPPVVSNVGQSSTFVSATDGATAAITWTTNEAADTKVEFGTTTSLGQSQAVTEGVTSHSVTLARLTPGATYHYRVSSTDVSGNGPAVSATASFAASNVQDTTPPTFSGINAANTTHNRIQIAWTTNENASSIMIVKKSATDSVTVTSGALTTSHSLAVTDTVFVRPGTAYTVFLAGQDATGNSEISSGQNVTTAAGPDVTAPPTPANLVAAAGNLQVRLTWNKVTASDLAGYDVKLSNTRIASGVTDTTYTVNGLTNGVAVDFTVQTVDRSGNASAAHSLVSATPSAALAPGAPTAPGTFIGGVAADVVSLKPILVVGNAAPVSGRPTPTYTFAVYSDSNLTNLIASISGVTQGISSNPTHWQVIDVTRPNGVVLIDSARYHWRSRASDTVSDGDWSAKKTFFTSSARPTAIQLANLTAESQRGIVALTWRAFDQIGLNGFRVYRSLNANGPYELVSVGLMPVSETSEYRFVDDAVEINVTYYYQIEAVNDGEAPQRFGPVTVKVTPPNAFTLSQNFPNPFNPATAIRYELPAAGQVSLVVYNMLGQEVVTLVDAHQAAGFHMVTWNGLNEAKQRVASGVYFYRIAVRDSDRVEFTGARKMLLLK